MANVTRQEDRSESQRRAGERSLWDPFGILSVLPAWVNPFGALVPPAPERTFTPAFDVRETKDAYVFEADLPGMEEDRFEVSVSGNQLSVRGSRESVQRDEDEKYSCAERTYGTFERTFTLSDDAESERVNAEFQDGVLVIEIPKRREPRSRRVPLRGAHGRADGSQQQQGAAGEARSSHRQRAARRNPRRKR
jgi:HSP20 family protein